MKLLNRTTISNEINHLSLRRKKMSFISGPRQAGKTTLSRMFQDHYDQILYYNWDESKFRKAWAKDPNSIVSLFDFTKDQSKLLILDEIHKSKGWKQKLKGLYDTYGEDICIIVTGSARLNIYKKGGDSLMGRYLNFRLHPFSLGEIVGKTIRDPEHWRSKLFEKPNKNEGNTIIDRLLNHSGFPEPYLANESQITQVWRQGRNEKIIREDLRDLSHLTELSQVEMLCSLLPEKVGSPLSIQSLREDLEVAHTSVTRWLKYLEELYYFFEIKPWSKSVPRSLKKEGKIYLYNWTEIEDEGARFENMIASHLLKACHFWSDTGLGQFTLHYLRNKQKEEIDFLITKNRKPWLMIEAKLNECKIEQRIVNKYHQYLKCPFVQIVKRSDVWLLGENTVLTSASNALLYLP